MTFRTVVIFVACLVLVACGRGTQESTTPAAAEPNTAGAAPHKEAPNTVEVDEGMLRDLRVTTREVQSLPGADLVTLLGELAVDQRGYAEVGAPVAARVSRLLVSAGDAVRSGQPLAELISPELGRERAVHRCAHLGVRRPHVLQEDRLPVAPRAEGLGREIHVDAPRERVRDDERRRREIGRAHLRMDAPLEVAVPREHGGDDEIVILDRAADGVGKRAGVTDAIVDANPVGDEGM